MMTKKRREAVGIVEVILVVFDSIKHHRAQDKIMLKSLYADDANSDLHCSPDISRSR